MTQTRTSQDRELPWTHFVRRCGAAAEAWVREYEQHRELLDLNFETLLLARRRRLDEARRRLAEMAERIGRTAKPGTSLRSILERYDQAVRGYYHYCRREWPAAETAMDRAHRRVVKAIEADAFLVTQANSCHEFRLHKARIARNRGRWDEMFRHIEAVRAMMTEKAPLCVLTDGTEIGYGTLERFYRSLELAPEERAAIAPLCTPEARLAALDRFVRRILAFPEFAIQYP